MALLGEMVPKIMDPDIGDIGLDPDPIPESLKRAQRSPPLTARDHAWIVLDQFEAFVSMLIIDEVGFQPLSRPEASLFFAW